MSKYIKFDDIDKVIREKHANAGSQESGQELFELFMEVSDLPTIEVSDTEKDGEDYLRGYNDGWYAHEVITNAKTNTKLHIDKPRGFTLKTEKGYGNYSKEELKSCDKVDKRFSEDNQVLYGTDHNCILTMFGECSYNETGCSDCAVAEKIRKALSVEVSEDCISKAYLEQEIENQIMIVNDEHWRGWNNALDKVVELIEDAPSVVPSREEGEWELASDNDGEYGICSICGNDADFTHYGEVYHYCPNCGAKMK